MAPSTLDKRHGGYPQRHHHTGYLHCAFPKGQLHYNRWIKHAKVAYNIFAKHANSACLSCAFLKKCDMIYPKWDGYDLKTTTNAEKADLGFQGSAPGDRLARTKETTQQNRPQLRRCGHGYHIWYHFERHSLELEATGTYPYLTLKKLCILPGVYSFFFFAQAMLMRKLCKW